MQVGKQFGVVLGVCERGAKGEGSSMTPIVTCLQDGIWTAFCPSTGAFATGATRAEAEAELRRLIEMTRAA